MRLPYLLRDKLGSDMNWYIIQNTPEMLETSRARENIKLGKVDDFKAMVFSGELDVNEPIDEYSMHTSLHDAVITN